MRRVTESQSSVKRVGGCINNISPEVTPPKGSVSRKFSQGGSGYCRGLSLGK